MRIRTLERMLNWGDKIGFISFGVFVILIVASGISLVASFLFASRPNQFEESAAAAVLEEISLYLFKTAAMSAGIFVVCLAIILYADVMLKKMRPRYTYGVNWKRDGF